MADEVKIYRIGTTVKLADQLDGRVTAICIREGPYITYEISTLDNGEHKTFWMSNQEFQDLMDHPPRYKIGFK
jgi:hypothetical protein